MGDSTVNSLVGLAGTVIVADVVLKAMGKKGIFKSPILKAPKIKPAPKLKMAKIKWGKK